MRKMDPTLHSIASIQRRQIMVEILGFECHHDMSSLTHPTTKELFYDFSAIAEDKLTEYAIQQLVNTAMKIGRNEMRQNLKDLMAIEEHARW